MSAAQLTFQTDLHVFFFVCVDFCTEIVTLTAFTAMYSTHFLNIPVIFLRTVICLSGIKIITIRQKVFFKETKLSVYSTILWKIFIFHDSVNVQL